VQQGQPAWDTASTWGPGGMVKCKLAAGNPGQRGLGQQQAGLGNSRASRAEQCKANPDAAWDQAMQSRIRQYNAARHPAPQHSTTSNAMAEQVMGRSTGQVSTTQYGTGKGSAVQPSSRAGSAVQYGTQQHSIVQHHATQFHVRQRCAVPDLAAKHCTVQIYTNQCNATRDLETQSKSRSIVSGRKEPDWAGQHGAGTTSPCNAAR